MNRFEGKNILFIYYKFPPIKGIGTLRNVKFYQSFKDVARKVFVATTSNRDFLPRDQFQYHEEDVVIIPTLDFRTIYHFLTGNKSSLMEYKDQTLQQWLPFCKEKFKQSIAAQYLDEGGAYFVRCGMAKCSKLIEAENIDMIVSSYMPYDAHLLAYKLKQKHPHLHWVADYRDFFSDPVLRTGRSFKKRNKKHQKILSHTDEITTVSMGIKKRLCPFNPNVHVVRNGIDQNDTNIPPREKYPLFTLAYTGSIYPQAQDASLLAECLQELIAEGFMDKKHIQLVNAGKDGLYWNQLFKKYDLNDILVNKGIIPYKASLTIQQKSHANILLSWVTDTTSGILTGKLFEYLHAGPPIIGIINGGFDPEIDELIARTSKGKLFYPGDLARQNLKEYLLTLYQSWLISRDKPNSAVRGGTVDHRGIIYWQDEFNLWAEKPSNFKFFLKTSNKKIL